MTRNIRLIGLYTICTNLVFTLPTLVLYYQTIGLSFNQFLIAEAAFSATVLLAEAPTGLIADVWQRRTTLMLGGLVAIFGYTTFVMATTFWQAVLAQCLIGVSVSLNSGTLVALLYDTLQERGQVDDYRRMEGRRHAFALYAVAISAGLGAWLFTLHPKLPYIAEIFSLLAGIIAISFAHEPARHKMAIRKNPLRDIAQTVHYALRGHPEIGGIIMISAVIFASTKLMMWTQQPYYSAAGIPAQWFGVILAGSYLLGGAASHASHHLERFAGNRAALAATAALLGAACIALFAYHGGLLAIPLFLVGTLAYATAQPRVNSAINNLVGSERRASILSSANLMVHVLSIPASLITAQVSDRAGVHAALAFIGGLVFVLAASGLYLWKRADDLSYR